MSDMTRRQMLGVLAATPLAAALDLSPRATHEMKRAAERAVEEATATGKPYAPKFFTAHEWRTVRTLVDLILPADERSGSATDAGVPEFMDFIMIDQPRAQTAMRGGLHWLDAQTERRFGRRFADCTHAQQTALLDDIAWPEKAPKELSQGVAWFGNFRDLTATGFWTTKMGIADLRYIGNVPNTHWNGCPEPALKKLGVSYAGWEEAQKQPQGKEHDE